MPEEEDFLSCPQPWSLSHVIWNFTQLPTKLFASPRLSLSESSSAVTANWSRPCALHRYTSARGDSVSLQNALTGRKRVFEYRTVPCFHFTFLRRRILQSGVSTKAEFRVWHCVTLLTKSRQQNVSWTDWVLLVSKTYIDSETSQRLTIYVLCLESISQTTMM